MKLRANCIDETNHRYGKLTVIEPVRPQNSRKIMWRCVCDCGSEIICSGSDLRGGKRTSCGKHCNIVKDEVGNVYGALTVLRRDYQKTNPTEGVYWICKCGLCGNEKTVSGHVLRKGEAKSCGCIKSYGEVVVRRALDKLGYEYTQEYSFNDLISPISQFKLRFDFALFSDHHDLIGVIEYQGEQHEKNVPYFGSDLENQKLRDQAKREYCALKDIPILYITHINGQVPSQEDVESIIQEFYQENYQNEQLFT